MKHVRLAAMLVAGSMALSACSDQVTTPLRPSAADAARASRTVASTGLKLGRNGFLLRERALDRTRLRDAGGRAINPDDYQCPASTELTDWYWDQFFSAFRPPYTDYFTLYDAAADLVPMYEALLFEEPGKQQYYGYDGEYTNVMNRTERDVKRFWDIPSQDIKVVPMHGSVLTEDPDRVAATYQMLFVNDDGSPLTDEQAQGLAELVRTTILSNPALNGGDHPFFTFNAVSFSPIPSLQLPPTIVMGDGILAGYAALGFDDVAPQAIFAHEFAHQIQFVNGYSAPADGIPVTSRAEMTRYTELMADAYSAYYLTHKRGAAMNRHRVAEFLEAFFQIGDCYFDNSGHHGTPNQRMKAAQFGFELADRARKQGHILTSEQFHELFVAAYPGLIAPDAS
jgi:hypothetical protein